MIKHLTIIGVGLIGSSLSLALKKSAYVERVTGCGSSIETLQKGVELGVIDAFDASMSAAVNHADVVVLAVPLGAMAAVMKDIKPGLSDHTVITDVGSAKASVVDSARSILGNQFNRFVAGHPIAGKERSGLEAGFATLYKDRKIILTPDRDTDDEAIEIISDMWRATGATIECMDVKHHDQVLAATSHLPHMLAFSLVSHLSKMTDQDEIFGYAAGGFRDFTRIASSDPVMWRDVCLANGDALLDLIEGFKLELDEVSKAIKHQDPEALYELFRDAKHTRDQLRNL